MRSHRQHLWHASAIALVALVAGCFGAPPPEQEAPTPRVRVVAAKAGQIAIEVPVIGTVVPADTSRVASSVEGLVVAFPYREGQFIEKDSVLAELRDVTLSIELERAKALFREQEQRYSELASGYREEEVTQAEARAMSADAARLLAEGRFRRLEELRRRSQTAITEEDLDEARFVAEQARHAHAEAKADYDMKSKGYRHELISAAQAAMEAARHEVDRLEDELAKRKIRAPFDGYVVARHTEIGEWLPPGGQVATVARLDEAEIRVNVDEAHIDQIAVGSEVDVRFDSLGGQALRGTVTYIVPKADWQQGSRSFPVVVRVKNSIEDGQPLLKEGMIARIRFRGPPREGVLAHKDAIVRTSGPTMVFVVAKDGVARGVEVGEGLSHGEFIEIHGDVEPGDLLVTEGAERLRPFDRVAILDPPVHETLPPTEQAMKPPAETASAGGS